MLDGYLRKSKSFYYEEKLSHEKQKVKRLCKCGHKVVVPNFIDKVKCSWCGCWVFRSEKDEFNYKLEIAMRKKKYE